jgi:hypothetical protein
MLSSKYKCTRLNPIWVRWGGVGFWVIVLFFLWSFTCRSFSVNDVNDLELYTFCRAFDVVVYFQIHDGHGFDGHLVVQQYTFQNVHRFCKTRS